jgi:hypothetical protein
MWGQNTGYCSCRTLPERVILAAAHLREDCQVACRILGGNGFARSAKHPMPANRGFQLEVLFAKADLHDV